MTTTFYWMAVGDGAFFPHGAGYIDNLPVDVMRDKGAHTIFAVDGCSRQRCISNARSRCQGVAGSDQLWRRALGVVAAVAEVEPVRPAAQDPGHGGHCLASGLHQLQHPAERGIAPIAGSLTAVAGAARRV
jgi:hypothetical protein